MDLDGVAVPVVGVTAVAEPAADDCAKVQPRPVLPSLQKTAIGTLGANGEVSVTRREPPRCLLYGPLWRLPQGRYRLAFRCAAANVRRPENPILGVEIIALNRLQQAWRDFTAAELDGGGGALEFEVPPALSLEAGDLTRFEFRFVHLANADLTITAVDLIATEWSGFASPGSQWRLLGRLQRWTAGRYRNRALSVRRFEPAGCVLRGGRPYIQLAEGRYRVSLRCRASRPRQPGQPVIAIEAVGLRGRFPWDRRQNYMLESPAHDRLPLAAADFTAEELATGEASFDIDIPLAFAVETGDAPWIEFKLIHLGNADLEIAALDLRRCGHADPDDPPPRRWRLSGRIARGPAIGEIAVRRNDRPGALVSSPRPSIELPPGHYRLSVACRVGGETGPDLPVFGARVGVSAAGWRWRAKPQFLAARHFAAAELENGVAALEFALLPEHTSKDTRLALRLDHYGNADLSLGEVAIQEIAPGADCAGRVPARLPIRRRNVLVIGNCQAETVAEAFRRAAPLRRRFDANYQFVGLQKALHEPGRRLVEKADLLLVQDVKDWESYPLREYIPDGIETIEFPFLRFASLWPFDGYGGVNDVEAHRREWPDLTFIYLDGLLGRLRQEIPDKEARFQAYRALELPGIVNYLRLHDFERRHLVAVDRKFGCDVGQFILDTFRQRQLFYAINHPSAEVFTVLLEWLMRRLGIEERFTEPLEHIDVVRRVQVPIHPKVARALGVSWADENTVYTYESRQIVWEQWVRAYIDHYG